MFCPFTESLLMAKGNESIALPTPDSTWCVIQRELLTTTPLLNKDEIRLNFVFFLKIIYLVEYMCFDTQVLS